MYHEAQYHEQNCFVTLTYKDDPGTLNVRDTQIFLKRLRKHTPIRYFLCGEYGEKTRRPHYHAIIFGTDMLGGSYAIDEQLYGNKILDRLWTHGNTAISPFTMQTACYTAGYVNKKLSDIDTFSTMSRNPPLGFQWAFDNQDMLNTRGTVVIEGQEWPVPKTYLKWYETTKFRPYKVDLDEVQANRQNSAREYTDSQLRNKEINQKASLAQYKGEKI